MRLEARAALSRRVLELAALGPERLASLTLLSATGVQELEQLWPTTATMLSSEAILVAAVIRFGPGVPSAVLMSRSISRIQVSAAWWSIATRT